MHTRTTTCSHPGTAPGVLSDLGFIRYIYGGRVAESKRAVRDGAQRLAYPNRVPCNCSAVTRARRPRERGGERSAGGGEGGRGAEAESEGKRGEAW